MHGQESRTLRAWQSAKRCGGEEPLTAVLKVSGAHSVLGPSSLRDGCWLASEQQQYTTRSAQGFLEP